MQTSECKSVHKSTFIHQQLFASVKKVEGGSSWEGDLLQVCPITHKIYGCALYEAL